MSDPRRNLGRRRYAPWHLYDNQVLTHEPYHPAIPPAFIPSRENRPIFVPTPAPRSLRSPDFPRARNPDFPRVRNHGIPPASAPVPVPPGIEEIWRFHWANIHRQSVVCCCPTPQCHPRPGPCEQHDIVRGATLHLRNYGGCTVTEEQWQMQLLVEAAEEQRQEDARVQAAREQTARERRVRAQNEQRQRNEILRRVRERDQRESEERESEERERAERERPEQERPEQERPEQEMLEQERLQQERLQDMWAQANGGEQEGLQQIWAQEEREQGGSNNANEGQGNMAQPRATRGQGTQTVPGNESLGSPSRLSSPSSSGIVSWHDAQEVLPPEGSQNQGTQTVPDDAVVGIK